MNACTTMVIVALTAGATACASPAPSPTPTSSSTSPAKVADLSGKVVWVDLKNSSLLLECTDDTGCKSVGGKTGETYPVIVPASMKSAAGSLAEGSKVKVTYEDRADGKRILKAVVAAQ